jgi:Secretion system C-terminal sorting domain/SdrD B-like domain
MKHLPALLLAMLCIAACLNSAAQVSGTVFRDYNSNGVKDNTASFNEPFVAGITVKATLASGTSFTTTSNALGFYKFTAGQVPAFSPVRIEFSGLAIGDHSAFTGIDNKSNVAFVTAPSVNVNYGVSAPDDYWNNAVIPDPPLIAAVQRRGAITNPFTQGQFSIVHLNNSSSGPNNPTDNNQVTIDTTKAIATFSQTGSVFGLAYQRKQDRFFSTALLKRVSGLGPQGAGGIYVMNRSGSTWAYSGSFTLQGVAPANGGAVLDFGSITRVTGAANAGDDNYIPDDNSHHGRDNDAFAKVGTMSYGDIEADPNSDKLYTINLYQKSLVVFDGSATTAAMNGASPAALSAFTRAYVITSLPGCPAPTGLGNNIRPYAVKIYKGKGYIGVVSDAMATQNNSDLKGYILQFDPANITAGFTTVITINFDNYSLPSYFRPWVTTWAQAGGTATTGPKVYSQPMISGLEFNEDGSMDIAMRDRWGDQGGYLEFLPVPSSVTQGSLQTVAHGEFMHACWTGSGWALEGTAGSCPQNIADAYLGEAGSSLSYNMTGFEYYADGSGDGVEGEESSSGGITKLMGTAQIVHTVYDPIANGGLSDPGYLSNKYWSTAGIQWNYNTGGLKSQIARVIGSNTIFLDKANVMGDVEFATGAQPLQIGNRIWMDTNGDGIQGPDETMPGVAAGTTVTLRSPGADGVYNTADDQTWDTVTDANGNYSFDNSSITTPDNRKPAAWTGVSGILPGYDYRIEVVIPAATVPTIKDVSSNANDNIDNDASANAAGTVAYIDMNTFNVSHDYDFGFVSLMILPRQKLDLTAVLSGSNANINWTTENEINTTRFVVERSTDGSNFVKTGEKAAAGTSAGTHHYNLADDLADVNTVIIYYRIKLVYADNSFSYSDIVAIHISKINKQKIWPNPFTSQITVSLHTDKAETLWASLSDYTGKTVMLQKYDVPKGNSQFTIASISKLTSGIYLLKITDKTGLAYFVQELKKQ